MKFPLIGPAYESASPFLSSQECINLLYEPAEQGGRAPAMLRMAPGIKTWGTVGSNAGDRGQMVMDGVLYAVYQNLLYSVNSGGVETSIGTISGSARVSLANNGTQLAILSESDAYIYDNSTSTLSTITDASFLASTDVVHIDQYFIWAQKDSQTFFISALQDGLTYDGNERANALTSPANIVALEADHKELWIFCEDMIEIWQNTGEADFPFSRLGGAFIERGCHAKHSVVKQDNSVMWLGEDLIVYRAEGYVPARISNFGIEQAIAGYDISSDAIGMTWTEEGHKMYALTFPTEKVTWVFDFSTQMWHKRQSFGEGYWRASSVTWAYNKWIVGDWLSSNIGELDIDTFEEYGNMMQAIRVGPTVHADQAQFSLDRIEVVTEKGVGLATGQGSDPKVALFISKNFGKAYGPQSTRSLGKTGEYTRRSVWRNKGVYRQCTPKLLITDPVRRYIIDAVAQITPRAI